MKSMRLRKTIVNAVALSGAILDTAYGISLLKAFFNPQQNGAVREILISGIILEFGWTALLVWAMLKPGDRRHIFLFTIIPIVLGNLLQTVSQWMDGSGDAGSAVLNTIIGLLYAGLFAVAYFLAKPESRSAAQPVLSEAQGQ